MSLINELQLNDNERQQILEKLEDPIFFTEAANAVFTEMDLNEDGYIGHKELYQGLYNLAEQMGMDTPSLEEIEAEMAEYDKNGDGRLSKDEFTPFAKKLLLDILLCEPIVEEIEEEVEVEEEKQ